MKSGGNLKGFRNKKQHVKTAKGRKISSTNWLNRHINDPFVKLAKQKGYRSRSAFKLIDIIEKFPILENVMTIIDLGCSPGGWLQVLKEKSPDAKIIGIDLRDTQRIAGVTIIKGDFLKEKIFRELEILCEAGVDLIISDMATDSSGDREIDHFRNMALVETAVEFCKTCLNSNGNFVAKMIRGKDDENLIKILKTLFTQVKIFKPSTSYKDSSEIYFIALGRSIA
jgi:23S rRNA (uridine2552-2'-O)-methyltransferase